MISERYLLMNTLRADFSAGVLPALRKLQCIPILISSRLSVRNSRISALLSDATADMLLYPSLEACLCRLRKDLTTVSSILNRPPEQTQDVDFSAPFTILRTTGHFCGPNHIIFNPQYKTSARLPADRTGKLLWL